MIRKCLFTSSSSLDSPAHMHPKRTFRNDGVLKKYFISQFDFSKHDVMNILHLVFLNSIASIITYEHTLFTELIIGFLRLKYKGKNDRKLFAFSTNYSLQDTRNEIDR